MSALDQTRALLDQLMGTGRDGENNKFKVRFDDPRVCKSFLLGCCPHDILSSTRMDLGECPKIHDLALKADFEMASKRKDYFYDIDAMEHLQSFIADCDRRTELAKRRLKETQEELSEEAAAKADVIHQLGEMIGTTLAKAEEVGAQGNVDESLKLMQDIEDLKKKKSSAEVGPESVEYRNSMPASSYQQQKLRVCEVCSAYLGIHDNDRRLADHFGGKLHLGFITIRQKLTELQHSVQERRLQREKEREERRAKEKEEEEKRKRSKSSERKRRSRSKSRSRSRDRRRRRSRSRSGSRKHSRRRRTRSRSKDRRSRGNRSESGRKSRSRSRSRKRSRRSRSRSKRSRSRTRRSRSRDRTRRSRNRSRDRKSRDRSSRDRSSRDRSSKDRSSKDRSSRQRDKSRDRSRDKSGSRDRSRERSKDRSSDTENPTKATADSTVNGDENGVKQQPLD